MLFSLAEVLQQIDPHVVLSDGYAARSVEQILFSSDPTDWHEYILNVDNMGRFLIYQIDSTGYAVFPPAYVEEKSIDLLHRRYGAANYAPEYAATA